jgi:hypothetical protein
MEVIMKATQATQAIMVAVALLLSGCGGCQHEEHAPSSTGAAAGKGEAGKAPAPEAAKAGAPGNVQVPQVQPTVVSREATPAGQPAAGEAAAPPAPEGTPAEAGADDGDCIVVGDANPDYGPPPLAVAFTAEAECSTGQPTYRWDFGDGSPANTDANPSHTYSKAGDYTATVVVTSPRGSTASDEIDITVEEDADRPD